MKNKFFRTAQFPHGSLSLPESNPWVLILFNVLLFAGLKAISSSTGLIAFTVKLLSKRCFSAMVRTCFTDL
ncbi:hypothetical protein M8994_20450, partial [Brucella sp. 21LCYQ03]|nr:hypothetical protein [Brucella sp. 21LCYQ03]